MLFIIDDILNGKNLAYVQSILRNAKFIDGAATANLGKAKKNNLEMELGENYVSIVEMLDAAMDASAKLNNRLMPRFRTRPILNRHDTGMFYAGHIDAPIQGQRTQVGRSLGPFGQNFIRTDYSMTLFLSDPETYEGGELELNILEETKTFKLRAGSAVCYSTGLFHAVRPVTSGSRIAAVYWFQSMIRDLNIRRVLWNLSELEQALLIEGNHKAKDQAAEIRSNFIRYLADI